MWKIDELLCRTGVLRRNRNRKIKIKVIVAQIFFVPDPLSIGPVQGYNKESHIIFKNRAVEAYHTNMPVDLFFP